MDDDDIHSDSDTHHLPRLPNRLIQLSSEARRITDADEEIFLLYTLSPPPPGRRGLGQVDSKNDVLTISFDLQVGQAPEVSRSSHGDEVESGIRRPAPTIKSTRGRGSSKPSKGDKSAQSSVPSTAISAVIHQDSTSLRSTAGDTGSVIWRSSLHLAACLARQLQRPQRGDEPPTLISRDALLQEEVHILELGSGTGVLPAILLPFLQQHGLAERLNWTATDQLGLLPLIKRNLAGKVVQGTDAWLRVEQLDWLHASSLLHATRSYAGGAQAFRQSLVPSSPTGYPDLIIAVDCIFNPALFGPLLDTLDLLTSPKQTIVLLVVELRSEEAMREFLEGWLARGLQWNIWSVDAEQMRGMEKGYVAWVGWKE